jgi:hypothetical protein
MARIELEEGEDPELNDLAQLIITAQSGEITQMNQLREQWYGAPSPAGGVPEEEGARAGLSPHATRATAARLQRPAQSLPLWRTL